MPQHTGNKARRVTGKITMGRKTVPCGCLLKDLRQDGLLMIALGCWRYLETFCSRYREDC